MEQLSLRLTDVMVAQLNGLAAERGVTRTRLVRQLLQAGLRDRPAPSSEPPSEAELVALLSENARQGNVSAIRSLLVREEDPRPCARGVRGDGDGPGVVERTRDRRVTGIGSKPGLRELELVPQTLRETDDPEVMTLFGLCGAPIPEREAWERLKDFALGADLSGFTALDLFTEVTSPGAHARVLARGWPIEGA
jgi:hypothetical protein